MRFVLECCLFLWLGGFAATSQVLPKSDGSCTVSAKVASLSIARPLCPDPNQREAKIGGNSITGYVLVHKKPLMGALVRLYASVEILAWVGFTDGNGEFATGKLLPPGVYRLTLLGGAAPVSNWILTWTRGMVAKHLPGASCSWTAGA